MQGEPWESHLMPQPRSQETDDWERGGGKDGEINLRLQRLEETAVDVSFDEGVREAQIKQHGVGL